MKKVISTERLPIKLWLEDIEEGALEQARNLANLPFAFKHVAIMPDSHQGYGMPIGGVLATKDVIIPNAVGVDIGCGMCAIKTPVRVGDITTEQVKEIMGGIREAVPVGFKHHEEVQDKNLMPDAESGDIPVVSKEYSKGLTQIGTLGGGNHFIEIQKGDDGFIWLMVHSGSRNVGYQIAKYHNDIAKDLNKKWRSEVPPSWELAFLPADSEEGQTYIREMKFAVEFALANRKLMMERIVEVFMDVMKPSKNIDMSEMINIAHNYASLENHFGQNVWVHRKGATQAKEGQLGIIPGSQGTSSYIVKGKGNKESFMSCSHGAGRTMSRTQAKKTLNLEKEKRKLDEKGIVHGIRHQKDLDEASSAYKDIDTVMENQKDLVDIVVKLEPLGVIKG